jgi:hypothetical protein
MLNYAWIAVREFCERTQKSLHLPLSFDYLSPIRPLLRFDQPRIAEPINVETVEREANANEQHEKDATNRLAQPNAENFSEQ